MQDTYMTLADAIEIVHNVEITGIPPKLWAIHEQDAYRMVREATPAEREAATTTHNI